MTQEDPRILELRKVRAKALEGGGEARNKKRKEQGKLTARERVELLLDPGTFNELEPFITHQGDELNLLKEKFYGDGVITGYGQINGRTVYLYSQDFTIYGGALSEMQSHKICRVMDLAVRNGVPFISLIDSGGARIQAGAESLARRAAWG
jgi:propionyl-CoA carboxylase beta chain